MQQRNHMTHICIKQHGLVAIGTTRRGSSLAFPYSGSAHRVFTLHVLQSCAPFFFMSFRITSRPFSFLIPIFQCPLTSMFSLLHLPLSFSPHGLTISVSLLLFMFATSATYCSYFFCPEFCSAFLSAHVSLAYIRPGLMMFLCTATLKVMGIFLSHTIPDVSCMFCSAIIVCSLRQIGSQTRSPTQHECERTSPQQRQQQAGMMPQRSTRVQRTKLPPPSKVRYKQLHHIPFYCARV